MRNLPKVFCIETGGTFASSQTKIGKTPTIKLKDLIDRYMPEVLNEAKIIYPPKGSEDDFGKIIDSSNIQPEDLVRIAEIAFKKMSCEEYKGILVTMGTDTMAYASAALSIMLQNLNKPLVITGSQRIFEEADSDAKRNFCDSVLVASKGIPGVHLVFNGRVINGRYATKRSTEDLDAFQSINVADLGKVDYKNRKLNYRDNTPFDTSKNKLRLDTNLDNAVKVEKLIPGYEPKWLGAILEREDVHGVVLEVFGLGGVPIPLKSIRAITPILERFGDKKPIIAKTQCMTGKTDLGEYEVGRKAERSGLISAGNDTLEYTTFKLKWLLGHTKATKEIRRLWYKV